MHILTKKTFQFDFVHRALLFIFRSAVLLHVVAEGARVFAIEGFRYSLLQGSFPGIAHHHSRPGNGLKYDDLSTEHDD